MHALIACFLFKKALCRQLPWVKVNMKKIVFTRSDYIQIRSQKFMFTDLSITLATLLETCDHNFELFYLSYREKIQSFLTDYDKLVSKIRQTNNDVQYFTEDLADLGIQCLKTLDEIGEFVDVNIQNQQYQLKHKQNLVFQKTFY